MKLHREKQLPSQHLPMLLVEKQNGAGFGTALQEKAAFFLLSLVLGRPGFIVQQGAVFNKGGALLAPDPALVPAVYTKPPPETWSNLADCLAARRTWHQTLRLPFDCVTLAEQPLLSECGYSTPCNDLLRCIECTTCSSHNSRCNSVRYIPAIADGDDKAVLAMGDRWLDRFARRVIRPTPLESLFPSRPFLFQSLSMAAGIASVPVIISNDNSSNVMLRQTQMRAGWASADMDAAASVRELAEGHGEFSGPACITRALTARLSPSVLDQVRATLAPMRRHPDALLASLHIRRGDNFIRRECGVGCINSDDEESWNNTTRVPDGMFSAGLRAVNASLTEAAARLKRPVYIFVAADSNMALRAARTTFGNRRVLSVAG